MPNEIGDTVSGWLAAVRAVDRCERAQTPKVTEVFVAFVILAVKHQETVSQFGHLSSVSSGYAPSLLQVHCFRLPFTIRFMEAEPEEISKQRANMRREYDTALRFLATATLTQEKELDVLKKLAALKAELMNLGERFWFASER